GQVDLKNSDVQHSLSAPPGPASFFWDSVTGNAQEPQRTDKLPPWAGPGAAPPDEKEVQAVAKTYRELLGDRSPEAALQEVLAGADREKDEKRARVARAFAVKGLAALGDVGRVVEALGDAKHADVRASAVVALRAWIGAAPGR